MIIHVRDTDGTTHSVEAEPTDTIHTLRVKIMLEGIYLSDYQGLVFNDKRLWGNKETIAGYGIGDEDTVEVVNVFVEQAMSGFYLSVVQPEGEVVRVVADEEVPVIQIKHELARRAGVEVKKQHLKAGDEDMKDERMLRDYGITGESIVWLDVEGAAGRRRGRGRKGDEGDGGSMTRTLLFVSLVVALPVCLWLAYKRGNKNAW